MEDYLVQRKEKNILFKDTLELVDRIYQKNSTGGLLHIVLDDGNLKDSHIKYCIEEIEASDDEYKDIYLKCANNLLKMTFSQRRKIHLNRLS
ncbi:MAG: hypothetical protein M0P99_00960 [Candidatus Cloacimonetes bacterium]|nr:hypothetical protein [Candidatus Cloacimonadota bacterium]